MKELIEEVRDVVSLIDINAETLRNFTMFDYGGMTRKQMMDEIETPALNIVDHTAHLKEILEKAEK